MSDNLKPDEGQIDKTSLNRSEYGKDGLVERSEKIRPASNLKNEGSRAWDTGRNEFAQAEKRPLKAKKIDDKISTYEGQIDKTSLNRSEYGKDGVLGKPEKAGRPNSQLKNEGNFNWETGRFEYNPAEQKPDRAKKSEDNLRPLDGQMDKTTQNRSEYGKHGLVPRAEMARPSTTTKPEGVHDWATGRNDFSTTEGYEITRAKKADDNLKPYEGKIIILKVIFRFSEKNNLFASYAKKFYI